jgi:hypothetical protein
MKQSTHALNMAQESCVGMRPSLSLPLDAAPCLLLPQTVCSRVCSVRNLCQQTG